MYICVHMQALGSRVQTYLSVYPSGGLARQVCPTDVWGLLGTGMQTTFWILNSKILTYFLLGPGLPLTLNPNRLCSDFDIV